MPLDAYLPNSQPQKIPALANVFFLCLKQNSFHVALECSAMTLSPPLFTYLVDLSGNSKVTPTILACSAKCNRPMCRRTHDSCR